MDDKFHETTGTLARKADTTQDTVRLYSDLGLIESRRLANGVRVFRSDAAIEVRRLLAERRGRGGRRG